MPAAADTTTVVVPFPTKRKAPYRNPRFRREDLPAEVAVLRQPDPEEAPRLASTGANLLLMSMIMALPARQAWRTREKLQGLRRVFIREEGGEQLVYQTDLALRTLEMFLPARDLARDLHEKPDPELTSAEVMVLALIDALCDRAGTRTINDTVLWRINGARLEHGGPALNRALDTFFEGSKLFKAKKAD